MFVALVGAVYKNLTLTEHDIQAVDSLTLAAMIIPTAILGSFIGGWLTHKLPLKTLRIVFILFMLIVALLTFNKARTAKPQTEQIESPSVSHLR